MNQTSVHLIRHAEAGVPTRWNGPDLTRPLSPAGRRQAVTLAELFADEPFAHLLSSPFLRCTQTLEPLAAAHGLSIETRDELADGQPWDRLHEVVLASEGDGPYAICVHGDMMRALMQELINRGVTHLGVGDVAKGSTWVLGVSDGAIVSARHVPAPSPEWSVPD